MIDKSEYDNGLLWNPYKLEENVVLDYLKGLQSHSLLNYRGLLFYY